MSENTQLVTTTPHNAALAHRTATDVAGAIKDFAIRRCVTIQGKKYPPVEVWQAVANGFGCVASARDVEMVDGGIRAIGEVRRVNDGHVIATGEGFVGEDEKTWAARPLFARRAMAQTRAISRACRAAFAFVVPMIDSGIATTPAEEMEGVVDVQAEPAAHPRPVASPRTVATNAPGGVMVWTDRLKDVRVKEGQSANGHWNAAFLSFENREEKPGTFDTKLAKLALSMVGTEVRVTAKPGRKEGTVELVSIEPADDIPA